PAVRVDHAGQLVARLVHRAVDHVARLVDAVVERAEVGLGEDVARDVDLHETGGGDLLVHHAVGIDEKGAVLVGHAHGDVVGHHVRHAVEVHQPVAGRQVHARLPFGWRAAVLHGGNDEYTGSGHGSSYSALAPDSRTIRPHFAASA